jgi:hypothetical protein
VVALSAESQNVAGILLLAIVAVQSGGLYMLSIVGGRQQKTEFQTAFARAGHAHAGVLLILALVCQFFVDAAAMDGLPEFLARNGVPFAAILMPAGFFFSSAGAGATKPNRFIVLLYAGIVSLAVGVVSLGLGLLVT